MIYRVLHIFLILVDAKENELKSSQIVNIFSSKNINLISCEAV